MTDEFDPLDETLIAMATANLNELADPYINPINMYRDTHPVLEDAYIRQPQVTARKLEMRGDPWWHIVAEVTEDRDRIGVRKIGVEIGPVTRRGTVFLHCMRCDDRGEREEGALCRHLLIVLIDFRREVKYGSLSQTPCPEVPEIPEPPAAKE